MCYRSLTVAAQILYGERFFEHRNAHLPAPPVAALEAVHHELVIGPERLVGEAHTRKRLLRPPGRDKTIARAGLPDARARCDERTDLRNVAVLEEPRDDLRAATVKAADALLHDVECARHNSGADPRLEGRGEHRHPAAVREPHASQARSEEHT